MEDGETGWRVWGSQGGPPGLHQPQEGGCSPSRTRSSQHAEWGRGGCMCVRVRVCRHVALTHVCLSCISTWPVCKRVYMHVASMYVRCLARVCVSTGLLKHAHTLGMSCTSPHGPPLLAAGRVEAALRGMNGSV